MFNTALRQKHSMPTLILLLAMTAVFTIFSEPVCTNAANLVIVLDPGHGGSDPGAVSTVDGVNYQEKVLNLKIASAASKYLEAYNGVTVYMTRTGDTEMTLAQRVSAANKLGAHVLISIHNNSSGDSSAGGTLVITADSDYRPELTKVTKELGGSIVTKLSSLGLRNRGLMTSLADTGSYVVFYPDGSKQDYYGIVQRSIRAGFPGIIIETAFISNPDDVRNYMSSDAKIDSLGKAIADGIAEYYGLSETAAYETAARIPIDGKKLAFNNDAYRSLAYPLGDTSRSAADGECLMLTSLKNAPVAFIDYMGMAINAKENMCAVITAKASYDKAELSVYCGSDQTVTVNDEYCFNQTLTTGYRHYIIDFSELPEWDMAVNFLQISVKGAESVMIKNIEFFSSVSEAKSVLGDSEAIKLYLAGNSNNTQFPQRTSAPTPNQIKTPKPTAAPNTTNDTPPTAHLPTGAGSESAIPTESNTAANVSGAIQTEASDLPVDTNTVMPNPTAASPTDTEHSAYCGVTGFTILLIIAGAAALTAAALFICSGIIAGQKKK